MKISHSGSVKGPFAPTSQPTDAPKGAKSDARKTPARRDSVEISDSGRALERAESPLTPERVRDIRDRIKSGAYDTVEVLGSIANRILDRGDA